VVRAKGADREEKLEEIEEHDSLILESIKNKATIQE
jgi:hypothetical protein